TTNAPQRAKHREAEVLSEIVGLIEAAAQRAQRMERHRHERVRVGEDIAAGLTEKTRERSRERAAPLVFEGVNDVAQRAVVAAGAACDGKNGALASAAGAEEVLSCQW